MRRLLVLLLLALLLLGGGSLALWFWTVGRLRAGFDTWTQQVAAEGWTVRTGDIRRAGWPFAADLVLRDMTLSAGPDVVPGGLRWSAAQAVLHLSPLAPDVLEIRLAGQQRLRLAREPEAPFEAASFVLAVPLPGPAPVQLAARDLRFAAPVEGMSIGLLDGQAQQTPQAVTFELSAEAIALPPPPAPQPALGGRIASATVAGVLDGPLPPPSPDPATRASAWQKSGGVLRVRHLALGWGPLGVTGSGVLGLDTGLQPRGSGTVRLVGYERALTVLAAGGAIRPAAAQAIRAVLTLLASTPEGGGAPQVQLPLALKDGVLRAGDIPVGRVPHWDWSAGP